MLTAIDCIRQEMDKITSAQNDCVNEYGVIKNTMKYRYQLLVKKGKEFKDALDWLTEQKTASGK